MKKDFKVNPVGLKGNEINERMRQLMGITLINENVSRSVVELTKIGPDGKAYAIVRENHEYFIKVSDKTSKLVTEDFKYIGGLQNKKQEAYPSYAKATKHLNLTFKSLAEAYGTDSNINVFEDDNLLSEENFATKHIVDKAGSDLKQDAKEGSEEDGFGDNVATGKVDKEFEKAKLNEGMAGFSEMKGNGFSGAGNLEENDPMYEEDDMNEVRNYIDNMLEFDEPVMDKMKKQYGSDKGEDVYYATANKQDRNPETFEKNESWMGEEEGNVDYTMGSKDPNQLPNPAPELHIPVDEEDDNVDYTMGSKDPNQLPNPAPELHIPVDEEWMEEDMDESYMEEDMDNMSYKDKLRNAKSPREFWDALDTDDANVWPVAGEMARRLGIGTASLLKILAGALGGEEVRNALSKKDGLGEEFPDLNNDGKTTYADILKGRGVELNEAVEIEKIRQELTALKKKL